MKDRYLDGHSGTNLGAHNTVGAGPWRVSQNRQTEVNRAVMEWIRMEIPPAPLCQRGVRAGSPLRKRGVRGDLLQHAQQSCHD